VANLRSKQASNGGSKELGNPVEDATEEGDVTTDEGAIGDSWVEVAAGDVDGDGYGDEKTQSVCQGSRHEPCRGCGVVVDELVEGHAGALPGKHEYESQYELCQR
jgi:hypothetical protein